jgi:hypothetical protein
MEPNLLEGLDLAALDDFMQREYGAGIHQLINGTGNAPTDDLIPAVSTMPICPFHASLKPGVHRYDPNTRTFYLSLEDFFPADHCTYHQHQKVANCEHSLRLRGAQTTQEFRYMGYSAMYRDSLWTSLIAGEQYHVRLFSDADDLADWIQDSNIPILSA